MDEIAHFAWGFSSLLHPIFAASAGGIEKVSLAIVVLQLALVYLTALFGGEICRRLGFPSLLGELIGGLLVGVSVLHLFVPNPASPPESSLLVQWVARIHGSQDAIPEVFAFQAEFFRNLANVGVLVLLFEIGVGANLNRLLGQRSKVIAVAGVGGTLSLIGGALALNAFFGVNLLEALFVGAALSVTSLGMTMQMFQQEGNNFTSSETEVIVGAAMLDDVIGIIALSLILSLYESGGEFSSQQTLLLVGITTSVIVVAVLAGQQFSRLLMLLQQTLTTPGRVILPALMFAFAFVLIASGTGLAGILGAFVAGLVLRGKERHLLEKELRSVVDVFVPIFFVYIGAETDLGLLVPGVGEHGWMNFVLVVFLLAIAVLAKLAGGYSISRKEGLNPLVVGLGSIPRGEVMLVFAEVGRVAGILTPDLFAILVVVSLASTLAASFGINWLKPEHMSIPVGGR